MDHEVDALEYEPLADRLRPAAAREHVTRRERTCEPLHHPGLHGEVGRRVEHDDVGRQMPARVCHLQGSLDGDERHDGQRLEPHDRLRRHDPCRRLDGEQHRSEVGRDAAREDRGVGAEAGEAAIERPADGRMEHQRAEGRRTGEGDAGRQEAEPPGAAGDVDHRHAGEHRQVRRAAAARHTVQLRLYFSSSTFDGTITQSWWPPKFGM